MAPDAGIALACADPAGCVLARNLPNDPRSILEAMDPADAAAGLLRTLEIDTAHVIGHHTGGVVALRLAASAGALVQRFMQNAPEGIAVLGGGEYDSMQSLVGTTVGLVSDRDRAFLQAAMAISGVWSST